MSDTPTREMAANFFARTADDTTGDMLRPERYIGSWEVKALDGTNRHCRLHMADVTSQPLFPESPSRINPAAEFIAKHEDDPIPETRPLEELWPELPTYKSSYANRLAAARTDSEIQSILDQYVGANRLPTNDSLDVDPVQYGEITNRDILYTIGGLAAGYAWAGLQLYNHIP